MSTGAQVVEMGIRHHDEVLAATDEVAAPLTERHDEELAAFDAQVDQLGARMAGPRNAMIARHKREQRRVRTADLLSGLATLVSRYRDALEDGGLVGRRRRR